MSAPPGRSPHGRTHEKQTRCRFDAAPVTHWVTSSAPAGTAGWRFQRLAPVRGVSEPIQLVANGETDDVGWASRACRSPTHESEEREDTHRVVCGTVGRCRKTFRV
jgi:hypothetical protein